MSNEIQAYFNSQVHINENYLSISNEIIELKNEITKYENKITEYKNDITEHENEMKKFEERYSMDEILSSETLQRYHFEYLTAMNHLQDNYRLLLSRLSELEARRDKLEEKKR
jgi:predicted  nucleic acid-binding Zn-ribbon protein